MFTPVPPHSGPSSTCDVLLRHQAPAAQRIFLAVLLEHLFARPYMMFPVEAEPNGVSPALGSLDAERQ